MKRLESLVAVHTHGALLNEIARNDKSFNISQNRRNLEENCEF